MTEEEHAPYFQCNLGWTAVFAHCRGWDKGWGGVCVSESSKLPPRGSYVKGGGVTPHPLPFRRCAWSHLHPSTGALAPYPSIICCLWFSYGKGGTLKVNYSWQFYSRIPPPLPANHSVPFSAANGHVKSN